MTCWDDTNNALPTRIHVSVRKSARSTYSLQNEQMGEQMNEQVPPDPMTTMAVRRQKGHTVFLSPERRSHLWEGSARGEVSPAIDTP